MLVCISASCFGRSDVTLISWLATQGLTAGMYDSPMLPAVQDIYDAKTAVEHLKGFNVANRYLILLYYNPAKINKKVPLFFVFRAVQTWVD